MVLDRTAGWFGYESANFADDVVTAAKELPALKDKDVVVDYTKPLSISSEDSEEEDKLELHSNGSSDATVIVVQRALPKNWPGVGHDGEHVRPKLSHVGYQRKIVVLAPPCHPLDEVGPRVESPDSVRRGCVVVRAVAKG